MSETPWSWLPEQGFGVSARDDGSVLIVHPEYGPSYAVLGRVDGEYVTLRYRFGLAHRPLDADDLAVMLDMNDQLVLFRLAFDDDERLLLLSHWPLDALEREFFVFWVEEMIGHAVDGAMQLAEYFSR